MEHDLGASRVAVTGAFSVGVGVSALAALPVGRWIDRHGAPRTHDRGLLPGHVSDLRVGSGRCKFRLVGTYKRHGKLDGEWRDCVIVERLLAEDAQTGTG